MGLLFIVPVILAVGITWIPESPRWLLIKGRDTDAWNSLVLLRQGAFSEEAIKAEFDEIKATIDITSEQGRFMDMFRGGNLRRTLIVIGVNVFLQLTGQNFVNNYGTIFIKSIGTINPFAMNSINVGINIFMVLVTQALTDITGRVYVSPSPFLCDIDD